MMSDKTKELSIFGYGAEIVVGTVNAEFVRALQDINPDQLDESDIEKFLGVPWSECDDIWHFYGPYTEFVLEDSDGTQFDPTEGIEWHFEEDRILIESLPKPPSKSFWDLSIEENFLIICVNEEIGSWGSINVPYGFSDDKLKVISCAPEFDTEYCVTLGFSYLGNILDWNQDENTRGRGRRISIFDIQKEEVILEF